MKFGRRLKTSLYPEWHQHYLDYDGLKKILKRKTASQQARIKHRRAAHGGSSSRLRHDATQNGSSRIDDNDLTGTEAWSEDDESDFVRALEDQLDKVYKFQAQKVAEISSRTVMIQKEVSEVIGKSTRFSEADEGVDMDDDTASVEDQFIMLEEDLANIIADVHDLAKFAQLNYTGFLKILKKHDKITDWKLRPSFIARLNAKPFYKENYDGLIVKLSRQYDLVRTRGNPVTGDSSAGGSQAAFVRQTTKYWVHPDNITELKLIILKHLPVLVFNANKEFEVQDSAITSIYFDNKDLDLYLGRLEKSEGAEAIRLRWYGGMDVDQIFVERKTHREDWTGEKSVKARFPIKEKHVNDFLKGDYTMDESFRKMLEKGKPQKVIAEMEQLATETQYSILTKRYRPVVRTFYNRTAFQLPGDARVRISLDTELTMVREDNFDGKDRTKGNWRRMDIGVDWPFRQLADEDVERFPYAVLEVKLQTQHGQEPPEWVKELVSSHLVEAVPKFSKFIHGTATLLPDMVHLVPFWQPQMDVDIRKLPGAQFHGVERPSLLASTTSTTPLEPATPSSTDSHHPMMDDSATGAAVLQRSNPPRDEEEQIGFRASTDANERTPLLGDVNGASVLRRRLTSEARTRTWNKDSFFTMKSMSKLFKAKYMNEDANIDEFEDPILASAQRLCQQSQNGPPTTAYIQTIRAPEGKLIAIPVRVEPKVYFANERTYLSWLEHSIYLSTVAVALVNFGDQRAVIASLFFMAAALLSIMYSMGMFLYRAWAIRKRKAIRYDDRFGPAAICSLMGLAFIVNIVVRVV